MSRYPEVALGEVLIPNEDSVSISPDETYRVAGIYSFGKGLFEREPIEGADTKYQRMVRLSENQLVYGRLNAWEGALAVVSREYAGCHVSQEYPAFNVRLDRTNPRYLQWLCRWPALWERLFGKARGIGSRSGARRLRVHPQQLLEVQVPLPDIDEQCRVAAKLDRLLGAINQSRDLGRTRRGALLRAVSAATLNRSFEVRAGWTEHTLGDLCDRPQYGYTARAVWSDVGPKLVRITDLSDDSISWETVPSCECPDPMRFLLSSGDLLIARTGSPGKTHRVKVAPPKAVFASYLIRLRAIAHVSSDYLYWYMQTLSYMGQIGGGSRGTAQQNVNAKHLQRVRVPVAPEDERDQIVQRLEQFQARVERVKRIGYVSNQKADALAIAAVNHSIGGLM